MRKVFFYLTAIIMMASCASSKKAQVTTATPSRQTSEWSTGDYLTSRGNCQVSIQGKNITLNSTLRMKRDDVVQLNLSISVIFEVPVATIELTPDTLLFVDRYNHRFATCTYNELSYISSDLTFQNIQKLFWGEAGSGSSRALSWKYGDFIDASSGRLMPSEITFTLPWGTSQGTLRLINKSFSTDSSWSTRTEVNEQKYQKVTLSEVISMLSR